MDILFSLSGEHPELPRAEVIATIEGENLKYSISHEDRKNRTIILNVETTNPMFVKRLALTKKVGEFVCASENLEKIAQDLHTKLDNITFAIKTGTQQLRESLGHEIWKLGYGVDLLNPNSQILCFEDELRGYNIAIQTPVERTFNERKPHMRPYFHPTTIDPKIARVLVNLSRTRGGQTILDPFCGTGGILIEAGLMDMNILGGDISETMVKGCKKNLGSYALGGDIQKCDALELKTTFKKVDAIVTDPPYGRSSYVTEKNLEEFYAQFMSQAAKVLDTGKYMVMVMPHTIEANPEKNGFEMIESYSLYVHKSLTRRIIVLKRK